MSTGRAQPKSRYSDQERQAAVDRAAALMADEGLSQNRACAAVGEDLGVSGRTIGLWAADLGIRLGQVSQETAKSRAAQVAREALAAQRDYVQVERLALLNEGFEKARALLQKITTPQELQQWSVATGTLIDKRRLEDGEATSRSEVSNGDDARARLASRLDELAQRRATKSAAG